MNDNEQTQRERQARDIFLRAVEIEAPEARAAFLEGACLGDEVLGSRVAELLADHRQDSFLEVSAIDLFRAPGKPGDHIGRYKLLEKIGEGGMGVVYMAEQEEPVRRRVALKIIKLGMDTQSVVARFEAERQALALMDHPNIAKVLDGGATDTGRPYFVMELVQGVPITEFCDKNRLGAEERIKLFIQVCQAIQSAHQKGIIHRDLKPTNILVTLNAGVPHPMVIDFGVAKATQQKLTEKTVFTNYATMIGTPAYMSPEQAEMSRLDVDTRSDIYGLGVLLYELLTGTTPFPEKRLRSAGYQEMQRIIMEEEPERPSTRLRRASITASRPDSQFLILNSQFSIDLDWIVMKCLEKDRARRYETANGLAADLKRHLDNEPVEARPPTAAYRLQKAIRRNKLAFTAGAAVAAALVVGIGISTWQAVVASRAKTLAKQNLAESQANAALAKQRLEDSEAISKFLTEVFQSPDPARDGRTITVAETLSNATRKLETELTNQPARRAILQATLARTYYTLSLYREAIPLAEKVRDYYRAACGPDHPDTLKAMGALAMSYDEAGRLDEALKLREEVLALSRKVNGPEHLDTLYAMYNLESSYREAGRRDETLKLEEEVLALFRKVLGPEHADTLGAMNNLALSYDDAGRRDDALKLREEVLSLRRKVNGPEHPDTLKAMLNLAVSYHEAGRLDEAIKLQEQTLTLCRKVLGPEHAGTLGAMNNLAFFYSEFGRRDEALKLREEVLPLYRKVNGPEYPDTLMAMGNLADSYDKAGRRDDALKLHEEGLALRRKVSGPEHPDTLNALEGLADSYEQAGRRDEALKIREEVLALRRKVLGPEHPDTLTAINDLAISIDEAGRRDEALKLREEVVALRRKVLGPEHPRTLNAMHHLVVSYYEVGRLDDAMHIAEEAAAATHRKNAGFLDTLAFTYAAMEQFDKAVTAEQEAIGLAKSAQEKKGYDSRLQLYQAHKPYREKANP